jgi:hypothetical protein
MPKGVSLMGKAIWLLALMLASVLAGVQATATTQANSNWARNGSFERAWVGWMLVGGAEIVQQADAPHGQKVLQCSRSGDMARQVIIAKPSTPYAISLWMRTENVKPLSNAGYAYAAIYEFDFHGTLVAFRDFVQLSGTQGWQRFGATWKTHQRTFYFEVRLGLSMFENGVIMG